MEKYLKFFIVLIFLSINWKTMSQTADKIKIHLDYNKVVHQMKGGIGASWHALIHEFPLENEKYEFPIRDENPRGSAYGGNPPLEDKTAWDQLCNHASWLGLNFLRVEISMRMYEPERNRFDFENNEMQALYRILDWCETNKADVFLQQMWGNVEWNSHSGVHPLLSSPKSLDDFANGIATLLKYLTKERKYTCMKYFCMTNEPPGGPWGYWWSAGNNAGFSITDAWEKLNKTFQEQDIQIPISGPDWTSLPPLEVNKIDFDQYLGAFDIHSYFGIYNKGEQVINDWVAFANQKNKPFFVTEIGNMDLGWGTDNPGPKSFKAALSNASDVAIGLNLGVDAFNRWSFTNRGNLDGQWQLVKTFDIRTNTYTKNVTPEKQAYYGFAMITRFLGKYASVLSLEPDKKIEGLICTAYKNTDGNLVVLMVNNNLEPVSVDLTIKNQNSGVKYFLYQVTEKGIDNPEFKLSPQKINSISEKMEPLNLPKESITVVTTLKLEHNDAGIIQ